MTADEIRVLKLLGEAFKAFQTLPVLHDVDKGDFADGIHKAQNVILSREGVRALKAMETPKT